METYFDLPYIYVFDASGLVNGATYNDLSITLDDPSEFRLRAVGGIPDVAAAASSGGGVSIRTPNNFDIGTLPSLSGYHAPIIPELAFPVGSQIRFSIYNVNRRFITFTDGTGGTYGAAKLLFIGVKRYQGSVAQELQSRYEYGRNYYYSPYTITASMSIPYACNITSTLRNASFEFAHQISDVDFELLSLGAPPVAGTNFEYILYDVTGRAMASDYVPADRIGIITGSGTVWSYLWPIMPVYYPTGSIFRVSVKSLADGNAGFGAFPRTVNWVLHGAKRIPC